MKFRSHIKCCRRLLIAALVAVLLPMTFILPAAAANNGIVLISDTVAETEATTQPGNSTSVGSSVLLDRKTAPAVSYGLRVLAEREEMVLSGLCGNEISFTVDDIRRALNIATLNYITITELPEPGEGTLFVGSTGAGEGQVISAGSLNLLSFAAADDTKVSESTMKIAVNGSDYAITCRLCLLDKLNYTPTVSLAPSVSLNIETYRDIPTAGTVSGYDPEGDEVTYEIVRYASHGRVNMTDRHTGAYVYTPDADYTGVDSFDYIVRDRYGNYSTSATVSIRVASRPSSQTYADIDENDHAAAIIHVSSLGLMNGTQVGNSSYFKPADAISRVEFLVTAMHTAGINDATVSTLGDPSVSDVEAIPAAMRPYVSYALQKNYIAAKTVNGKPTFDPNASISRAEAAVILSNIIGYATEDTVTAFADRDALPAWSNQALTSLRALGVLAAPDGKANASTTMTRENTAVWLSRTIHLMQAGKK